MTEPVTSVVDPQLALPFGQRVWNVVWSAAPSVGLFFGTLMVGLFASKMLRKVVIKLVDKLGLEVLAEKIGLVRLLYGVGIRQGVAKLSGQFVYVLVLVLTAYVMLTNLGLPGVTLALERGLNFMPNVAAAAAMMLGGALGAEFLKKIIAGDGHVANKVLLGQVAYFGVLALVGTLALEQLGFEVALIHALVQMSFGAVMLVLAIVFALSSQETFKHLFAKSWAKKMLRVGDHVVWNSEEGVLEAFESMSVVLRAGEDVEIVIPYHTLMHSVFELREDHAANDHTTP